MHHSRESKKKNVIKRVKEWVSERMRRQKVPSCRKLLQWKKEGISQHWRLDHVLLIFLIGGVGREKRKIIFLFCKKIILSLYMWYTCVATHGTYSFSSTIYGLKIHSKKDTNTIVCVLSPRQLTKCS